MVGRLPSWWTATWLAAATLVACGPSASKDTTDAGDAGGAGNDANGVGTGSGSPDASDAPSSTSAAHPALPQVPNNGGPILAHPALVTITFAGYPYQADIQAFDAWLVTSSWLEAVGAEYGVGTGTNANVVLTDATPAVASTGDIETFLTQKVMSGALPQPQAGTLYVIYYPPTTVPSGMGCSGAWWGHSTVASPVKFAYAAIPACPPPAAEGWSQIESIEQDASHEIIESATDPEYFLAPAYAITDPENPWHYVGSEVGDLCVAQIVQDGSFFAQRVWSNQAAASGTNPCVPAPAGDEMFDVSPASGTPITLAAGASQTVAVSGWSSSPGTSWVAVGLQYPGFQATLSPTASLSPATFTNGAPGQLTITVPTGTASGSRGIVMVESVVLGAGNVIAQGPHEWPILVQVP
jgi:hypothetical protein